MDIRNCKKCNALMNYDGNPLCPKCMKEMEQKFLDVRQYIYDNPTATMVKVSEELDVPIQQIKKWIREERLAFAKDSGMSIDCEKCGKPILTGRFCVDCRAAITDKFSSLYREPEAERKKSGGPGKMRFLQK